MEDREIVEALVNCATECNNDCPMKDGPWRAGTLPACRAFEENAAEVPVELLKRTIELLERLLGGESA